MSQENMLKIRYVCIKLKLVRRFIAGNTQIFLMLYRAITLQIPPTRPPTFRQTLELERENTYTVVARFRDFRWQKRQDGRYL